MDITAQIPFNLGDRMESEKERLERKAAARGQKRKQATFNIPKPAEHPTMKWTNGIQPKLRRAAKNLFENYMRDQRLDVNTARMPENAWAELHTRFLTEYPHNPQVVLRTFRNWCTQAPLERGRKMRNKGGGRLSFLTPEMEAQLLDVIDMANEKHKAIPVYVLRLITPRILGQNSLRRNDRHSDLKLSDRWVQGFLKRNNLSLRTPERVNHGNKPRSCEEIRKLLLRFWSAIILKRLSTYFCNIYRETTVFNFFLIVLSAYEPTDARTLDVDELRLYFGVQFRKVIAKSSQRHVASNLHRRSDACTLVLAISAAGKLLPIQVVLKDRRDPAPNQAPLAALADFQGKQGVHVVPARKSPFTTPDTLQTYFDDVVFPYLDSLPAPADGSKPPFLFLWDSWWAHTVPSVIRGLTSRGGQVVIVPKSCTPFVQPLDTHINKIFRELFKKAMAQRFADAVMSENLLGASRRFWRPFPAPFSHIQFGRVHRVEGKGA